jgi:transposase
MAADGLANDVIATRLDTSPQVVHRWRKRFCDKGLAGLGDNLRSGRPVTFGPCVAVEAKQLACELRPSAACRCHAGQRVAAGGCVWSTARFIPHG